MPLLIGNVSATYGNVTWMLPYYCNKERNRQWVCEITYKNSLIDGFFDGGMNIDSFNSRKIVPVVHTGVNHLKNKNQKKRTTMQRNENLYAVESEKSVSRFVEDFAAIVAANDFVINNKSTMNMKETFTAHGGIVPEEFDLHMIQICKPTKADKSLSANPERAILMPKFVHVFSKENKTHVRYLSQSSDYIAEFVPGDAKFPKSLEQTFSKIRSMIDEAK